MENNVNIVGKFYLKNGIVIDEEVSVAESSIDELRDYIKKVCRSNEDHQITFGYTTFRVKDISAVTIKKDI